MKNRNENTTIFLLSYSYIRIFFIFFKCLIVNMFLIKKALRGGPFLLFKDFNTYKC